MAQYTNLPISKDAAKKHYLHSGATATITTTGAIASTVENYNKIRLALNFVRYNASGTNVGSVSYKGTAVNSPMTSGTSFTASHSESYDYVVNAYAYQINDNLSLAIDTDKLSGTAAYTYGTKATPTASCNITGGYINPTVAQTFRFTPEEIDYIDEQYTISSGTLYYKLKSAGAYTSKALTDGAYTLPANTFTAQNVYEFYADLVMDDGTAVTTSVTEINTNETTPTVTAVGPSNIVTYGSVPFSWTYSISTGTAQYAYDIQISTDQVTWTDVSSHTVSDDTSYTATVSTAGTLYWRVRGYNTVNTASAWSNVLSFVNVAPPDAPTISSVSGTGRLTVAWNSNDQIAFQVIIGNYDSGWVYSTDKTYFLNEYLKDGNYTIKVRIASSTGLISDWATLTYTQNLGAAVPTATLDMMEGYNQFSIDAGTFDKFYIIRNGVVIAQTSAGTYDDYFCNGADEYIIRGVYADDTFADLHLTGAYTCNKPAVITPNCEIIYVNERLDEQPDITNTDTLDVVGVSYLGRSKPVHHVGDLKTRTWSIACSQQIGLGQIYYYRNFRGDKAWVICKTIQSGLNWFGVHEYQFTLEETDYNEGIDYEI